MKQYMTSLPDTNISMDQRKRIRSQSDPNVQIDKKRQNMSETPEKQSPAEEAELNLPTTTDILCAINKLHEKFDQQSIDLKKIQNDFDDFDERLTTIEDNVDMCTGGISVLNTQHGTLDDDIRLLKDIVIKQQTEINQLKVKQLDHTARSMQSNLLFHNITEPQTTPENFEAIIAKELKKEGICLPFDITFKRCHRLGPPQVGMKYPRPIIAKISSNQIAPILEQAKKLQRGRGLWISRQMPQEYREKKQKMWEISESMKTSDPSCKTKITPTGNLLVNGQSYKEKFQIPSARYLLQLSSTEREDLVAKTPKLHEGKVMTEGGSSFVAAAVRVKTINEARNAYQVFLMKPGRLSAAHNIATYRLYSPGTAKTEEGWVDDNEHGAGKRIRNHLLKKNLTNVLVLLSRGSYGTHLGIRRHTIMLEAVDSALAALPRSDQ